MSSEWDYKDWRGNKASCKRRTEIMDMGGLYWSTRHGTWGMEQIPYYPVATGDKYVFYKQRDVCAHGSPIGQMVFSPFGQLVF